MNQLNRCLVSVPVIFVLLPASRIAVQQQLSAPSQLDGMVDASVLSSRLSLCQLQLSTCEFTV
jgi:hypothetical protein